MDDLQIVEVAAAVIFRGKTVLLCSRPPDKPPRGWEFPGGKRDEGETLEECLKRELREELALECEVFEAMGETVAERPGKSPVRIRFLRTVISGDATPLPQENQECRWEDYGALENVGLLGPDREFATFLKKLYNKNFPETLV